MDFSWLGSFASLIEKHLLQLVAAIFWTAIAAMAGLETAALVAVGAGTFLLAHLIKAIITALRLLWSQRDTKKRMEALLAKLDPIEKVVLLEFAWLGQQTIFLPYLEPPVAGLLQKGVLAPASNDTDPHVRVVRLSPLAEALLDCEKHLGLKPGPLDDGGAQFIYGQRCNVYFLSEGIETTLTGWPY